MLEDHEVEDLIGEVRDYDNTQFKDEYLSLQLQAAQLESLKRQEYLLELILEELRA